MIKLKNALGAEKVLPPTIFLKMVPLDMNVPVTKLEGMDGAILTGKPTLQARQITLEGRIYHAGDKEKVRQEADSLLAFLTHYPIEVHRGNRHLLAFPQGVSQDWIDKGIELGLQLPMIAPDPLWRGEKIELTLSGTQYIEVEGNSPVVPFVETTGSVSSLFSVINGATDQKIIVSGGGGKVEVDSVNFEVKVDGENRVDLASDEWLANGFYLYPGENLITSNVEIKISYMPRWF